MGGDAAEELELPAAKAAVDFAGFEPMKRTYLGWLSLLVFGGVGNSPLEIGSRVGSGRIGAS